MRLLTKCCFKIPLKTASIMILSAYWILSATYIILLIQYFTDHTVLISILIGVIFITWFACSTVGLYGIAKKKNAYYLIPEIVIDAIDCILHLINLVFRLFNHDLVIPRFTVFGKTKTVMEADQQEADFRRMIYYLFDERYPMPNSFAFFDLCIRGYLLLVLISYVLEFRNRSIKRSIRKAAKKKKKTKIRPKSIPSSTSKLPDTSTQVADFQHS